MIRILLLDESEKHHISIEKMFSTQKIQQYVSCWRKTFCPDIFHNAHYDIVLIVHDQRCSNGLETIKQVIHLELPAPIIFLSTTSKLQIDEQAMGLGAADFIPMNELSAKLLDRAIRHAIGRRNSEAKLSFLATHDPLTGLVNRYLFHEHLTRSVSIAKRQSKIFGLLFLDLDKFKYVNDSLGHDVGDMLLIEIANRIRKSVRSSDIVARIGGDEFTVLLDEPKTKQEIAIIAKKIQLAIEPVMKIQQHDLYITTSIGIAHFPECGIEPKTLMKSADIALYKAKELGRNKYQFFTNDLNEKARLKLELEKSLRRAMLKGEFELYFQPQVFASNEKTHGFEALLRWNHPTLGIVSPADFLPVLEELTLLVDVEEWVIKQVCHIAKELTDKYGELRFSINISGSHFKVGNLKQSIYLALQETSLDAHMIEIELTEDIMIEHVERSNNILTELSELGISIALDDFGKGYSSLSYLKDFPANVLKIDKAFIDNIVHKHRELAIVEAMIDLSHKLGINVVAEGVEHEEQVALLKTKQCDFIQGYFFAKPMPAIELDSYLTAKKYETAKCG